MPRNVTVVLSLPDHIDGWDSPREYVDALLDNQCGEGNIKGYAIVEDDGEDEDDAGTAS